MDVNDPESHHAYSWRHGAQGTARREASSFPPGWLELAVLTLLAATSSQVLRSMSSEPSWDRWP